MLEQKLATLLQSMDATIEQCVDQKRFLKQILIEINQQKIKEQATATAKDVSAKKEELESSNKV